MNRLVVALGQPHRGDDGVGPAVLAALAGLAPKDVALVHLKAPLDLLDLLARQDRVVVVDAVRASGAAGAVRVLEAQMPLPTGTTRSGTHGFGLAEVIELARRLGRLPGRVTVVGVTGRQWSVGDPLSAEVDAAVKEAAAEVLRALD